MMDAAKRDEIRFARSDRVRAETAAPNRTVHMETHEEWEDEVHTAIGEYEKLMAGRHAKAVHARLAELSEAA